MGMNDNIKRIIDAVRQSAGDKDAKALEALHHLATDRMLAMLNEHDATKRREFSLPKVDGLSVEVATIGPMTAIDWRRLAAFAALCCGEFDEDEIASIQNHARMSPPKEV